MNRWKIYWRNIGLCSSCRSSYRLLNYIGWKPEELSPVLYINLSVAKNFPFYVQDIWKVRSCKTCVSTLLKINLQTKANHTHPKLLKWFLQVKRDADCCGFALFFRGLASGELKVNKLPAHYQWMSSTWRKDDDELVKLRYHWNDSRWHKRGIQFCKFTFTWPLFPGSSVLL